MQECESNIASFEDMEKHNYEKEMCDWKTTVATGDNLNFQPLPFLLYLVFELFPFSHSMRLDFPIYRVPNNKSKTLKKGIN